MKEVTSINIVCLGNWNKRIFTPNWVATKLFELGENVKFQGVLNPQEMEFGFSNKDVLLLPKDNVLEIKLAKINEESKAFSGVLLNRILTLLPHTPIKAIGINIRYSFNKTEEYKILETLNQINCQLNDFSTNQIRFSKDLDNCQLNIITDMSKKKYFVNFNYHYVQFRKFNEAIINEKVDLTNKIIEDE